MTPALLTSRSVRRGAHLLDEEVLERPAKADSATRCAHPMRQFSDQPLRRSRRRQLEREAAVAERRGIRDASLGSRSSTSSGQDRRRRAPSRLQPSAVSSSSEPDGREASLGENRHATAERLGVAQDVRAEEHRAPLVPQLEDQLPHLAPAERIESRHRLVEEHDLRVVDERLRDADALHHALRELPQLEAPLRADADFVEQPRCALPGLGRAVAEQAGRSRRAAPRPSGCRRSTGFSGR